MILPSPCFLWMSPFFKKNYVLISPSLYFFFLFASFLFPPSVLSFCPLLLGLVTTFLSASNNLFWKGNNHHFFKDWFLKLNVDHQYFVPWFLERGSKFEIWILHQNGKAGLLVLKKGWLRGHVWLKIYSGSWELNPDFLCQDYNWHIRRHVSFVSVPPRNSIWTRIKPLNGVRSSRFCLSISLEICKSHYQNGVVSFLYSSVCFSLFTQNVLFHLMWNYVVLSLN